MSGPVRSCKDLYRSIYLEGCQVLSDNIACHNRLPIPDPVLSFGLESGWVSYHNNPRTDSSPNTVTNTPLRTIHKHTPIHTYNTYTPMHVPSHICQPPHTPLPHLQLQARPGRLPRRRLMSDTVGQKWNCHINLQKHQSPTLSPCRSPAGPTVWLPGINIQWGRLISRPLIFTKIWFNRARGKLPFRPD